jgi:hypothetical protein
MLPIDSQRLFAGGIFKLRRLQEHDTVHASCIGALSQLRALLGLPEGQASVKPGGARVVSEVAQLVAEVHVQPGSRPAFTQWTNTQALMAVSGARPRACVCDFAQLEHKLAADSCMSTDDKAAAAAAAAAADAAALERQLVMMQRRHDELTAERDALQATRGSGPRLASHTNGCSPERMRVSCSIWLCAATSAAERDWRPQCTRQAPAGALLAASCAPLGRSAAAPAMRTARSRPPLPTHPHLHPPPHVDARVAASNRQLRLSGAALRSRDWLRGAAAGAHQ